MSSLQCITRGLGNLNSVNDTAEVDVHTKSVQSDLKQICVSDVVHTFPSVQASCNFNSFPNVSITLL